MSFVTSVCSGISLLFLVCSLVWTLPFCLTASSCEDVSSLTCVDDSSVLFSAALASWFPTPNNRVAPTNIDAVPTENFLIEYLFILLGKKSNFLLEFFKKSLLIKNNCFDNPNHTIIHKATYLSL